MLAPYDLISIAYWLKIAAILGLQAMIFGAMNILTFLHKRPYLFFSFAYFPMAILYFLIENTDVKNLMWFCCGFIGLLILNFLFLRKKNVPPVSLIQQRTVVSSDKLSFKRCLVISLLILGTIGLYGFLLVNFISLNSVKAFLKGANNQQLRIKTYYLKSSYQNHDNAIDVLLPDNLSDHKNYPVLYILPVAPAFWDAFWINGIKEAAFQNIHNKYQVICVYPHFERMPWYGDHPRNLKIRQESYLVKEVIPFVDKKFPINISKRELVGFSKSGYGAYSLLLRYPHIFDKAASWDAPLMMNNIYQWGTGLEEIFENEDNFKEYFLPDLLKQKRNIFVNKEPRFILTGYAFIEDHTKDMHAFMRTLNIPHIYHIQKRSTHTWDSGWLSQALNYLIVGDKNP